MLDRLIPVVDEGLGNSADLFDLGDGCALAVDPVMCGHGERAATAAGLLARAGHHAVSIHAGDAHDWEKATGRTLDSPR